MLLFLFLNPFDLATGHASDVALISLQVLYGGGLPWRHSTLILIGFLVLLPELHLVEFFERELLTEKRHLERCRRANFGSGAFVDVAVAAA